MKESFILYNSFYEPIKALKNEQLGKLFRAIFNYTTNGEVTQDNDIIVAFMFIKNQIDLDAKKWEEERTKRSEAGKKGMQNRWHNSDNNVIVSYNNDNNVKNVITKITDNVNVNVNENDNVNVNVSSNIYTYVEQCLGRTLNGIEYELISKWDDNELTRYAIQQAMLNGGKSIKYIQTILNSYKAKGYISVEDVVKDQKKSTPGWFDKEIKSEKASGEEINELQDLLKEFN